MTRGVKRLEHVPCTLHGAGISLVDGVHASVDFLERYAGLDLYERAVMAAIREKADQDALGEIGPVKTKQNRRKVA